MRSRDSAFGAKIETDAETEGIRAYGANPLDLDLGLDLPTIRKQRNPQQTVNTPRRPGVRRVQEFVQ